MLDFLEFGRLGLTTEVHAGEKHVTYRFHCSVEMQLMEKLQVQRCPGGQRVDDTLSAYRASIQSWWPKTSSFTTVSQPRCIHFSCCFKVICLLSSLLQAYAQDRRVWRHFYGRCPKSLFTVDSGYLFVIIARVKCGYMS
jgi:hypothetical protein